ncbi:MAG: hypothetical protein QM393_01060 [Bacillota bacterium]|jgi:fluoroquinolone transport system permease protein|nr:hypothetical protein [Bacillota bacterium]
MGKYLALFRYEMRTIWRDPLNLYMCAFPLIMLGLSAYVFPLLFASMDALEGAVFRAVLLVLLIAILAFGSFFLAAMAAFLLLEQKDEHTLHTIAVTPLGAGGYLQFKMAYVYLMSVLGSVLILAGTKLIAGGQYVTMGVRLFDRIGWVHIIAFAAVNGLFTLVLALFQGAAARNKVEGFALIKGTGILALLPALMILETFQGNLQYVLGIFPNFWPIRSMLVQLMPLELGANLSFAAYLIVGGLYNGLLLAAAYRLFLKKAQY